MLFRVCRFAGRWLGTGVRPFGAALLFVAGAVGTGVLVGHVAVDHAASREAARGSKPDKASAVLQEGGEWLSEAYWRRRREKTIGYRRLDDDNRINPFSAVPAGLDPNASRFARSGGSYRTLCVRLCDGYYFPISFSTDEAQLAADERSCQSSCSSEARLFYYPSADGSPETMIDRRGGAYADLKTAFLYRTTYSKSCQCKPDPWSDEARQRHATYQEKGWEKRMAVLARSSSARDGRDEGETRSRKPRSAARTPPPVAVRLADEPLSSSQVNAAGTTDSASRSQRPTSSRGQVAERRSYAPGRMSLGNRAEARPKPRQQPAFAGRSKTAWKRAAFSGDN